MKLSVKSLALSFALGFSGLCATAATPGLTFLFSDGKTISFAFENEPKITMTSTGVTVTTNDDELVPLSYTFDNITRYYFEDDVKGTTSSVGSVKAQRPVFSYADGIVSVNGLAKGERVALVSVNGATVASDKASADGSARLDVRSAQSGVYILTTGSGVSFKLLKK